MTREEALKRVKGYLTDCLPLEDSGEIDEIMDALEQEPRKDEVILTKEEYGELVSSEFDNGYAKGFREALEQEPCKVSEYDKDHIWYKGHQYISLRRFLKVKAEAEQEPCEDAVSRQDAIMHINFALDAEDAVKRVEELPPVTPTRPKGHWIMNRQFERRTCDNCNKEYRWSFYPHNYCPNCGADMKEGEA